MMEVTGMNMPGFTAEVALRKTTGHYRTGRRAINLSKQMISAVEPAVERNVCQDVHNLARIYLLAAINWNRLGELAGEKGWVAESQHYYALQDYALGVYYSSVSLLDEWGC
jgi:hypothetical protein